MRKLIYHAACSLDGFIARQNHAVDWLPNTGETYGFLDLMERVDTVLIGGKSYDFMVKHDFYSYEGKRNIVVSSREFPKAPAEVEFVRNDICHFVQELRLQPGKDIWLVGGGQLANTLMAAKLIDEWQVFVVPILLGSGIRLFPDRNEPSEDHHVEFVEQKVWPGGHIELFYVRKD